MNFQVGPVVHDELARLRETEESFHLHEFAFRHSKLVYDELTQRRRRPCLDLQADNAATTAAFQRALEIANEVFGLFLDFDIAVTQQTESALPDHRVTGKQPVEEQADHVFQTDEADPASASRAGSLMKRSTCVGTEQQRVHQLAVRCPAELQREGKAQDLG